MVLRRIWSLLSERWPMMALFAFGVIGMLATRLVTAAPGTGGGTPSARNFDGVPAVGALFGADQPTHHCTASVVAGLAGEDASSGSARTPAVVLTAAHCLAGTGVGLTFVPGYRSGSEPFGSWAVVGAYADPRWISGNDQRYDYAFLLVDTQQRDGAPVGLGDVVGGYRLAGTVQTGMPIEVVGYVSGANDLPIGCATSVYQHQGFAAFDCAGFAGGTSGAPWLAGAGAVGPSAGAGASTGVGGAGVGASTGVGGAGGSGGAAGADATVTGVIGGWRQGGCTPSTSYSSMFDQNTVEVYRRAVAGGPGDVLPDPGADGC